MGILDKLKQHKDDADAAADTLKHKAASGLDKAGQMADDKTGHKYTDKIDAGVEKAKRAMGEDEPDESQPSEQPTATSPDDEDTQTQPPVS
jgi:hypothetical protein